MNTLDKKISILKILLKKLCQVDLDEEWDEAWHEEAVKEFGDEVESIDDSSGFVFEKNVDTYIDSLAKGTERIDRYRINKDKVESDLQILKENGIDVIEINNNIILGYGMEGRVYNVVYKGVSAAAKVVTKKSEDIELWNKILNLNIPEKFKKHIPKIYLLKKEDNYSLIVLEQLLPLPVNLSEIWRRGNFSPREMSKVDYDKLYNKEVLEDYVRKAIGLKINLPTSEELSNELPMKEELPIPISYFEREYKTTIDSYMENTIRKILNFLKRTGQYPTDQGKEKRLLGLIVNDFYELTLEYENLRSYDYSDSFPYNSSGFTPDLFESIYPGFKNFLMFMFWLTGNDIYWRDLHNKNIMIGKDDNEIKLVDIGYFIRK